MKSRKEKFESINASFKKYVDEKMESHRLLHLFNLDEDEIVFLNQIEFFNIYRAGNKEVVFLEVTCGTDKYVINAFINKAFTTVTQTEGENVVTIREVLNNNFQSTKKRMFTSDESQVILFLYIRNSGALAALQEIPSKKVK